MSEHEITMTVDGEREQLTVEARRLLVHALREQGHTAPNVGCESGKCGACTVELDGEAVKSCCLLAVQADGAEVTTVAGVEGAPEGLALAGSEDGAFGPVQESFHEEHGLQGGYCTPGMGVTARELPARNPEPTPDAVP